MANRRPALTPAEDGILAAAMDEALRLRLSDDRTIEHVATAILGEVTIDYATAWRLASRELDRRFPR
ncbi:hypothetical protein [Elioraea sp.]|uniref:hypothetical protein n=1 Tax=Elioraea sp. TaxID=2185103 RepID=UPI003F70C8B2